MPLPLRHHEWLLEQDPHFGAARDHPFRVDKQVDLTLSEMGREMVGIRHAECNPYAGARAFAQQFNQWKSDHGGRIVPDRHPKRPGLRKANCGVFFARPANFADRPIADIEAALGPWTDNDDWDWGRLMYDWVGGDLRVRVRTRSNIVTCVDYYNNRGSGTRFAKPDQTIWRRSGPEDHWGP